MQNAKMRNAKMQISAKRKEIIKIMGMEMEMREKNTLCLAAVYDYYDYDYYF